jgi:hypothetical protein
VFNAKAFYRKSMISQCPDLLSLMLFNEMPVRSLTKAVCMYFLLTFMLPHIL